MKVLVCVKQCFDPESKIVIEEGAIREAGLRVTVNPYDAVALTQASKLKKAGKADEVVAVMVERKGKESTMRHALAIGADRGILCTVDGEADQMATVGILADVARREQPDLIMLGHLSSDRSSSQVASRLSAELGIPAITMASHIDVDGDGVTGTHDLDDGRVVSHVAFPAIVSAQVYMTQAHYVAMKSLMQAKKKTVETIDCGAPECASRVLSYELPPAKAPGTKVEDAEPDEAAQGLRKWIVDVAGVQPKTA